MEIRKLYEKYREALLNYAINLTHDRDTAEDLTQDAFLCAIENIEKKKRQGN